MINFSSAEGLIYFEMPYEYYEMYVNDVKTIMYLDINKVEEREQVDDDQI